MSSFQEYDSGSSPGSSVVLCEDIDERVIFIRWPRLDIGESRDEELLRDYEEAVRALHVRDSSFALIHDFRNVEHLSTLLPLIGKILPDAISISKNGLVKRVCILHNFKHVGTCLLLGSLARLSPVRPCRVFNAKQQKKGIEWASEWQ